MESRYQQLGLEDRIKIACLQSQGRSIRQIAATLDRAPSTVSREIRRNRTSQSGYLPVAAQDKTKARRWTGSMLDRKESLRDRVLSGLKSRWSPEQIVGRLEAETGERLISHETIYRFIYAQITRTNDYAWRLYLPRAKAKRGYRGHKGGSPANFIKDRVSIHIRPSEADNRKATGHWEADYVLFSKYNQSVLAALDKNSRLLLAEITTNRTAAITAQTLSAFFDDLPLAFRQTMTFDNGTEFCQHTKLHQINFKTYFCDPHAPWQKGSIENAIGRLRRFLPRKTDLANLSKSDFSGCLQIYNTTPRKCLNYKTPAEVFCQQLLHFKCESTSRLASG
jgi:transposase, IS30 family